MSMAQGETAQVSEEESGSGGETSNRQSKHVSSVVSQTVELKGMTREGSDARSRIDPSSQCSDISGEDSPNEDDATKKDAKKALKLPKKKVSSDGKDRSSLRKGKWTLEEEEYTSRIIHYFSTGLLTLPEGYTLRSYLAEKLNCDPMRITKKYAGAACLGRRAYHFRERAPPTIGEIQLAKAQLDDLEHRFRMRVEEGYSGVPIPSQPLRSESILSRETSTSTALNEQMNQSTALQTLLQGLMGSQANSQTYQSQMQATGLPWNAPQPPVHPAPSMFPSAPAAAAPLPQQGNPVESALNQLVLTQAASNLVPALTQLLSTSVASLANPGAMQNANVTSQAAATAALLPALVNALGAVSGNAASAPVAPQQNASGLNFMAQPTLTGTQWQQPSNTASKPASAPPPAPPPPTHVGPMAAYMEEKPGLQSSSYASDLKRAFDHHLSSMKQQTQASSSFVEPTSKPPMPLQPTSLPVEPTSAPAPTPPVSSISTERCQAGNQADGSVLVGFLSSLRESYLKALQAPGGNGPTAPAPFTTDTSRTAPVTDTSSVSNHGSSAEEGDFVGEKRSDVSRRGSSKGPPRKRHKAKQTGPPN